MSEPTTALTGPPDLRDRLSTRKEDLDAAARDFGNVVHRRPRAVVRARDAADVVAAVRHGRANGLPVVPRGAGHTVDGQAQIRDGIVVDLSGLAGIGTPGADRISVGAGAPWSAVVDATLPAGLTPPVVPDYLPLTVGGTVSAGGVSGSSHRYGCVADNVHELDVVTPDGDLVTCSPTRESDLFDAVRGTQGGHGVIVRATLGLTAAPAHARRYLLVYRKPAAFLSDQLRLIGDRRFFHVGGQVQLVREEGWRYVLEAVATFSGPEAPDDRELLKDLGHERGTEQIATTSFREFLDRIAPFEAQLRAAGAWGFPHPRCTVMLPGEHALEIVTETISGLTAATLGPDFGGNILLYPVPTDRLAAPNMPKARDAVTVVFGLQRTAMPGDETRLAQMLRGNAELRSRALGVGGSVYTYPTAYHEALHG